jgi:hypothetical protein
MGDHPGLAEQQQDRLLQPRVHLDLVVDDLGDTRLTSIEQIDRLPDHGRGVRVLPVDFVASAPKLLDPDTHIRHDTGPYRPGSCPAASRARLVATARMACRAAPPSVTLPAVGGTEQLLSCAPPASGQSCEPSIASHAGLPGRSTRVKVKWSPPASDGWVVVTTASPISSTSGADTSSPSSAMWSR